MRSTLLGILPPTFCIFIASALSPAIGAPPEKTAPKTGAEQSATTTPAPGNVQDKPIPPKRAVDTTGTPGNVSSTGTAKAPRPRLTNPIAVLREAAKELERMESFYYEATLKGFGTMASVVPSLWATVILGGESTGDFDKFRLMVPDVVPGPAGLSVAMVGSDGKTYFLVDVKNKTVTQSYDPKIMSDMAPILPHIAVLEVLYPEPFAKEMKEDIVELKGDEMVMGTHCYVVHVSSKDQRRQANWYFATEDLLPRRVDRITKDAAGKTGTTQVILQNVIINPRTANDPFVAYFPKNKNYKSIDLRTPKPQNTKDEKPKPQSTKDEKPKPEAKKP